MKLDFATAFPKIRLETRTSFGVPETARLFGICDKQVIDLIEEGSIDAINIARKNKPGSKMAWRIPVATLVQFIEERSSLAEQTEASVGQMRTGGRRG